MFKSLNKEAANRGNPGLFNDDLARVKRELVRRRRAQQKPPIKSLTSDPAPSTITNHSEAMALHRKHVEGGNQGAANFWKRHADKIKKRQGWTSNSDIVKEISK
jgi:hypothetical protein